MDGRPTWTDCDEAGDYVVPNVLSPRDLVFRPDNMDETVPHMTLGQGQEMTLTFNTHIPSLTQLVVCIYRLSGHRLQ